MSERKAHMNPLANVPTRDEWQSLKAFTAARIALGHAGVSVPTTPMLEFRLAHAHARDAVYSSMNIDVLFNQLVTQGHKPIIVQSQALSRAQYLQRPDLGRLPGRDDLEQIEKYKSEFDIAIILADGLSATSINEHSMPLLSLLIEALKSQRYSVAPIVLAQQARVAIADPIAFKLGAKLSIILIGERPGLSAADSLGAYITFAPRPGLTDECRNCVSNIRPGGLRYADAADKILFLVEACLKRKLSGVAVKEAAGRNQVEDQES